MSDHPDDPHSHTGQPVLTGGTPVDNARAALVLVHGRGADAAGMFDLARLLGVPNVAWLAPQARNHTWYPSSFLAPIADNEPGISSGIALLDAVIEGLAGNGIPPEHVVLLGFSQGACLSLECAARRPGRYGGVAGLSGGLIGPPGTPRDYPGSLDGTPVFLGCSDHDPHIPEDRVHETDRVLAGMGASVTTRIYRGMGHTINAGEMGVVREMVERAVGR